MFTEKELKQLLSVIYTPNNKIDNLEELQLLSLTEKIKLTEKYIKDWFIKYDGKIYVSFSGGLDSTVLLNITRKLYPDVLGVFSDTGLEYPEIRSFVKSVNNIEWVYPKTKFKQVIETEGYPIISKRISRYIRDIQNPTDKNKNTRNLRLTGISSITNPDQKMNSMKIPNKWLFLTNAPFKISEKCCDYLKKEPLNAFSKENKMYRIIGVMAEESNMREQSAKKFGINVKDKFSQPIIFWNRNDILQYILINKLPYCSIYGDIIYNAITKRFETTKEQRTGCMFCMFGVHLEKPINRFQRMKITHPNQYEYCINKLNCKQVLDYIGVEY